uniref:Uncharacterized protein n=1 Tax=virus sp. ct5rm7 TaxID=2827298 RepID=A0A8S5RGG7_9VIRU|nr:MAG TPA: hypothetical protein [virus sp. ct5rm7]
MFEPFFFYKRVGRIVDKKGKYQTFIDTKRTSWIQFLGE